MAVSIVNAEGIGNAFGNLGQMFAQGPQMAAEADLNRQKRANIIADTAIRTQQHDVTSLGLQNRQQAAALLAANPQLLNTTEGLASIAPFLTGFDPNTTAAILPNAPQIFQFGTVADPTGYMGPLEASNTAFSQGQAWQNTPVGVQQHYAAEAAAAALKAGQPQTTGFQDFSPADAAVLDTQADAYLETLRGKTGLASTLFGGEVHIPDDLRQKFRAFTGEEARIGGPAGAPQRAAERLGLTATQADPPSIFDWSPFAPYLELQATGDPVLNTPGVQNPYGDKAVLGTLNPIQNKTIGEMMTGGPVGTPPAVEQPVLPGANPGAGAPDTTAPTASGAGAGGTGVGTPKEGAPTPPPEGPSAPPVAQSTISAGDPNAPAIIRNMVQTEAGWMSSDAPGQPLRPIVEGKTFGSKSTPGAPVYTYLGNGKFGVQ